MNVFSAEEWFWGIFCLFCGGFEEFCIFRGTFGEIWHLFNFSAPPVFRQSKDFLYKSHLYKGSTLLLSYFSLVFSSMPSRTSPKFPSPSRPPLMRKFLPTRRLAAKHSLNRTIFLLFDLDMWNSAMIGGEWTRTWTGQDKLKLKPCKYLILYFVRGRPLYFIFYWKIPRSYGETGLTRL